MISPDVASSDRSTGHPSPSALASVNSSFVPSTLKLDSDGSIFPYSGIEALYRVLSAVGRSTSTVVGEEKSTLASVLEIFFRYSDAWTVVPVW